MKDNTELGTSVSIFILMTGVGMVVASLPLKMLSIGGTEYEVSMLMASFAAPYVVSQIPYGLYSDKHGFKKPIAFGFIACAVSGIIYHYAQSPIYILLGRMIQGVGEAPLWSLTPALLSLRYPQDVKRSMGLYNSVLHLGLTIGPIMGIVLISRYASVQFIIFSLLCTLGGAATCLFVVDPEKSPRESEVFHLGNIVSLVSSKGFIWVLTGVIFYGAGYANSLTVIPIYLVRDAGYTEITLRVYYTLFYLMISLSQILVGRLNIVTSLEKMMSTGMVLGAIPLLLLGVNEPTLNLLISSFGLGIYHVSSQAWLSKNTKESLKGTISGAFYLFWGIGYCFGPIITNALSMKIGYIGGLGGFGLTLLVFEALKRTRRI